MVVAQAVKDSKDSYDMATLDISDTQVLVIERETTLTAAFRGTETDSWRDVAADLKFLSTDFVGGGKVHRGFAEALMVVWPDLVKILMDSDKEIIFTGHSLGGALATLAGNLWNLSTTVTFGAPRVGDKKFWGLTRNVHRCRRKCDIVPLYPMLGRTWGRISAGTYYHHDGEHITEPGWSFCHRLTTFRGQKIGWRDHKINSYVDDFG